MIYGNKKNSRWYRRTIYNAEYNLAVSISLGNKWFTETSVAELVEFSLPYSKDFLVVYVADTLHAINIEVRNERSRESALRKAKRMGDQLLDSVKHELEGRLDKSDIAKVFYKSWDDILTDDYKEKQDYLHEKYSSDTAFREAVLRLVREGVSQEKKDFSESDIERLGEYIINELPELLTRVPIDGLTFDANVYPFDNELLELVENIQNGQRFPEIADELMDAGKKGFVEVR